MIKSLVLLLATLPSPRDFVLTHVRVVAATGSSQGVGSGVVVWSQGNRSRILTARHVVKGARRIRLEDGTTYWRGVRVWFIKSSSNQDLALLEADKKAAHVARIAPYGHTVVGSLIAVGGPHGRAPIASETEIIPKSWPGKRLTVRGAFRQGRSGGGLFDSRGYLVGIQSATNFGERWTIFEDITRSSGWVDDLRHNRITWAKSSPARAEPVRRHQPARVRQVYCVGGT